LYCLLTLKDRVEMWSQWIGVQILSLRPLLTKECSGVYVLNPILREYSSMYFKRKKWRSFRKRMLKLF
jgi:hypothetical protein